MLWTLVLWLGTLGASVTAGTAGYCLARAELGLRVAPGDPRNAALQAAVRFSLWVYLAALAADAVLLAL